MYSKDKRVVVTLDAGGTNFDFGAMQGNRNIVSPINKASQADNLDRCLATLVAGFSEVIAQLEVKPTAISFAFPGPADYPNGVIGGFLPNFPSFRDGVALGPFLEQQFGLPVFINNDADLFVYGEALAGALPDINNRLAAAGSKKRYRNLIGFTWGTGFGFGMTTGQDMHIGDNSCCEVFCLPSRDNRAVIAEEYVAIRAIKRYYAEYSGTNNPSLEPIDIFRIAEGETAGNTKAAKAAFAEFGRQAGDVAATVASLIDGLIVIGGGLAKAHKYIIPSMLDIMNEKMQTLTGSTLNRLQMKAFNLDNNDDFAEFAQGASRTIKIFGSDDDAVYDPQKRIGVSISKLGASRAVAIGAYAFALNAIDRSSK